MGFKIKPPYTSEPTPIYEVPFDNPDLVAKANKNGTIIVNKDRVHDKELMDEAMSHEKQHLKDMKDGNLDYDNLSVTFKGKRYNRDTFDEGNQNLPWEKVAYAAGKQRKQFDLTPKKEKLTGPPAMSDGKPLLVDNTSSPFQSLDENEVNMNEDFGPSMELDEVQEQLEGAVIAHGKQAKAIGNHIKEMKKGSSLQSPIKMWGAPAQTDPPNPENAGKEGYDSKGYPHLKGRDYSFQERYKHGDWAPKKPDVDPSGEAEVKKQVQGNQLYYDTDVKKFQTSTGNYLQDVDGDGKVNPFDQGSRAVKNWQGKIEDMSTSKSYAGDFDNKGGYTNQGLRDYNQNFKNKLQNVKKERDQMDVDNTYTKPFRDMFSQDFTGNRQVSYTDKKTGDRTDYAFAPYEYDDNISYLDNLDNLRVTTTKFKAGSTNPIGAGATTDLRDMPSNFKQNFYKAQSNVNLNDYLANSQALSELQSEFPNVYKGTKRSE